MYNNEIQFLNSILISFYSPNWMMTIVGEDLI